MKNEKKEEWNINNLINATNINNVITNLGHFTFKITNSNAISGGLMASQVDLDGYVCMSNTMRGNEYEILNNPTGNSKVYKRIEAVIENKTDEKYINVNPNDVLYIKKKLLELENSETKQSLNLNVINKRLKNVIIQEKDKEQIKNKELIILRSSGFAKVLKRALAKENQEIKSLIDAGEKVTGRKMGQMGFGGTKPINIGVNGYLMSNVLYFNAPQKSKNDNFDELYKLHKNGLKMYDLINVDFLKTYNTYLKNLDLKGKSNLYFREKEKELFENLFNFMKNTVNQKYLLLKNNFHILPNKNALSNELDKKLERILVFGLVDKEYVNLFEDFESSFVNNFIVILTTKTFYIEDNKPINLSLDVEKIKQIKKIIMELLWQNI